MILVQFFHFPFSILIAFVAISLSVDFVQFVIYLGQILESMPTKKTTERKKGDQVSRLTIYRFALYLHRHRSFLLRPILYFLCLPQNHCQLSQGFAQISTQIIQTLTYVYWIESL